MPLCLFVSLFHPEEKKEEEEKDHFLIQYILIHLDTIQRQGLGEELGQGSGGLLRSMAKFYLPTKVLIRRVFTNW